MNSWTPESWQQKQAEQQPDYQDKAAVADVVDKLSQFPPLVTSWEVESLKSQLAEAADGKRFLLHGGDCAESFAGCRSDVITNKLKILLQMSLVMVHGMDKRVIRIGRFAGQYAKPRSSNTEVRNGVELPSYRGDLINELGFSASEREPRPELMLRGYERAALTLNYIRSLVEGGFADLHHPENWNLDFMDHAPLAGEYREVVADIGSSLHFMENILGAQTGEISRADFFTSHEALLLPYEQAQTRPVPKVSGHYNLSTHFPWLGARTQNPDGAHVEYLRGIRNPIGLKVGPQMTAESLMRLLGILDPEHESGRITLIHRFGVDMIEDRLPGLIEAVQRGGRKPLWVCDPMHGNTISTKQGLKTRRFDHILDELERSFAIHQSAGSYLGGVHFELTGADVTECVGGARGLEESDLQRAYKSQVDPRLNYEQALEMAMLVVRAEKRPKSVGEETAAD